MRFGRDERDVPRLGPVALLGRGRESLDGDRRGGREIRCEQPFESIRAVQPAGGGKLGKGQLRLSHEHAGGREVPAQPGTVLLHRLEIAEQGVGHGRGLAQHVLDQRGRKVGERVVTTAPCALSAGKQPSRPEMLE